MSDIEKEVETHNRKISAVTEVIFRVFLEYNCSFADADEALTILKEHLAKTLHTVKTFQKITNNVNRNDENSNQKGKLMSDTEKPVIDVVEEIRIARDEVLQVFAKHKFSVWEAKETLKDVAARFEYALIVDPYDSDASHTETLTRKET